MKKLRVLLPVEKRIPFSISELPDKVFCPECNKLVAFVVVSDYFLYLYHSDTAICVVDNAQGHWD